ncbi:MAG: DUF72 domain-containing protein [Myxococcota bacterium]|nr:DUF72 domain-containing protein [Myxococcota bacterium]
MAGRRNQLGLFEDPDAPPVEAAPVSDRVRERAEALPSGLYLGTSSWSFPGWTGIVWGGEGMPDTKLLAHEGLRAYAHHPLLNAVGLDRTFYGPIATADFERYAEQVPRSFRFLVKADGALTKPGSERFLDVQHATHRVITPARQGLGERLGPVLFQFPPASAEALGGRDAFLERLGHFLSALPRGPLYSVELRTPSLIHGESDAVIEASGAVPCFNLHPDAPPLARRLENRRGALPPTVVIRWMLRRGFRYAEARDRYAPFDRLVDEDPESRAAVAELCLRAADAGRPVYVIANNKAEGSAPLTLAALAEEIERRRR